MWKMFLYKKRDYKLYDVFSIIELSWKVPTCVFGTNSELLITLTKIAGPNC